ncbi:MAG: HD domain-containing protein [Acidobacteria bacterium]|nr:HD domain-containing protein [Acidobacteriota bacterium]MBU4254741.1 HD domain-containing protein [Acidobacteriota bacterium]MBU4330498.1 HD domain-containing protein [Acidobacteriota bacterium]MBU4495999.1 HD domain-containing protein [Acidobacteriota bacterium]MCG2815172.1 HD domain-containing protein [Candidatus Aminicenantes bacterium]
MSQKTRLDLAVEMAAAAHRNQMRKFTDIPYITHPFGVAVLLLNYGYAEDLVIAGLLHDAVEDSSLAFDDIRRVFGSKVAGIVEGCSEPVKTDPWMVRKSLIIEVLREADMDTKIVACADKLHNVRSITSDYEDIGSRIWQRFNEGQNSQEWYYRRILESFASPPNSLEDIPLFLELKKAVEELFRPTA